MHCIAVNYMRPNALQKQDVFLPGGELCSEVEADLLCLVYSRVISREIADFEQLS